MNGRRARAIRRSIYGTEYSPRERIYHYVDLRRLLSKKAKFVSDTVLADDRRRAYQQAKDAAR